MLKPQTRALIGAARHSRHYPYEERKASVLMRRQLRRRAKIASALLKRYTGR